MNVTHTRAQTEPLATLVSITAVAFAITVYTTQLYGVLPELGSEDKSEEALLDVVWERLAVNGVVDTTDRQLSRVLEDTVYGTQFSVIVLVPDDYNHNRVLESVTIGANGTVKAHEYDQQTSEWDTTDARTARRVAPVRVSEGDIRPGTLVVERHS